jgi:hypothetical protein
VARRRGAGGLEGLQWLADIEKEGGWGVHGAVRPGN